MKTNVKVFAETLEESALEQIKALATSDAYREQKIRIMPDAHSGKGCVIGTTMTITDKITPNLVGVDIGCGITCIRLPKDKIDLARLDEIIRTKIPSGNNVHEKAISKGIYSLFLCREVLDEDYLNRSLGTLGGGNHFIELNISEETGHHYLTVHSGSRYLGVQVCKYYQTMAIDRLENSAREMRHGLISHLKSQGREKDIQEELEKLPKLYEQKDFAYLDGIAMSHYLNDMQLAQAYAAHNRGLIARIIMNGLGLDKSTLGRVNIEHNYIDIENKIMRKGAIAAYEGQDVVIPIMRDGSIIGRGKGNPDWNYSAPHGAGRLMSRTAAKKNIDLADYEKSMEGIYSSSVNASTIDEAPQAYKPIEEITRAIKETVDIIEVIRPIYNFKANE